jgi:hypothetical protein
MLCVLDKYHQFEYVLLQDSVRYFAAEGAQLVNAYDTARFLALVDRRLQVASVCRINMCVHFSTSRGWKSRNLPPGVKMLAFAYIRLPFALVFC